MVLLCVVCIILYNFMLSNNVFNAGLVKIYSENFSDYDHYHKQPLQHLQNNIFTLSSPSV